MKQKTGLIAAFFLMIFFSLSQAVATTGKIHSPADLADKRIAVITGSAGDSAARKHFPSAKIQDFSTPADAALAVKTNKFDALIFDRHILENLQAINSDLVVLNQPLESMSIAAGFHKENAALQADINRVLQTLEKDGTLQSLRQKWETKYQTPPSLPEIDMSHAQGVLRMGTNADLEPYAFHSNGKITGLGVELALLIGLRLGKKIEISDMEFAALIPSLNSKKIDFILANLSITEEQKKHIRFSDPYIENEISVLVRKADVAPAPAPSATTARPVLHSVNNLKDQRIGVITGSAQEAYVSKTYPAATLLQYNNPADMLLAVKTGKADTALFDTEVIRFFLRQNPELKVLEGDLPIAFPIGAGINQNNTALRDQFNRFLHEIRQNGVHEDMRKRWFDQWETRMPEIPATTPTHAELVVAIDSASGLPFTGYENNRHTGFDIELATRFANFLGKELKLVDMPFSSIIAAVTQSKVDMALSGMFITDERKKQIIFSDPYFEMGTSAFTLKTPYLEARAPGTAPSPKIPDAEKPSFFQSIQNSFYSNLVHEKRYLMLWEGIKVTLVISVFSCLFGTLLGAVVSFMRMSKRKALSIPARIYIDILRGIPVLVFLMLIFYVVFASVDINPVIVAVIAFGMNFSAYVAEFFRTGIEGIDKGQREAGISLGFTPVGTFFHIILPQMIQRILPVYKGEFISLVKMTSIVGYIAVQDLTKAGDIIRSRTFDAFFPLIVVAILYFLIAWLLTQSLEYLERKTDPRYRKADSL